MNCYLRDRRRMALRRELRLTVRHHAWQGLLGLIGLGACIGVVSLGCSGVPRGEWNDGSGYRWATLVVPRRGKDGFKLLPQSRTGIAFENELTNQQVLDNQFLLNGSGVAVGDVDGDGLADIYFAALGGSNVLYRNLGGWRFEEVTDWAGVAVTDRFCTGAVFADVDADGDLDLLVTVFGGPNRLFLNDGTGRFEDRSSQLGKQSDRGSTSVTMADVDGDGDLDLYIANYKAKSVRDMYPPEQLAFDRVVADSQGKPNIRQEFRSHFRLTTKNRTVVPVEFGEPDNLYLNDGTGRFSEVGFMSGRFVGHDGKPLDSVPADWGLTAKFYDMDRDGDPDLYVTNDFESPDRFWLNDGTGRFRLVDPLAVRVTSGATMAIGVADIERDGDLDFLLVDMLDLDSKRRKTQTVLNLPEQAAIADIAGRPQVPRNTLLVGRGDGTYAEAAYYAGIQASGWSWSAIFLDVDLDGYEDVLITNGYSYDFLDLDTSDRISRSVRGARSSLAIRDRRFLLRFPPLPLSNVAFRNNGDLTFTDRGVAWGFGDEADVSHGAATGDLDGDGDLDVVVNRLGKVAGVYRNESSRARVAVRLQGLSPNTQGIGTKIHLLGGAVPDQVSEVTSGGEYVSGSDPVYMFAVGDGSEMGIRVEWRSGKESVIGGVRANRVYEVFESGSMDVGDVDSSAVEVMSLFRDATVDLGHVHVETEYDDWVRQPLLRHSLSQLGPGVTWYDMDGDGDEDLLIGGGRGGRLGYYRNEGGRFRSVAVLGELSLDETTLLAVPNGLGGTRLLVGQMNYEASSPAVARAASSVLGVDGDWGGSVVGGRVVEVVPGVMSSTGPLAVADYDGDGDLDLFVGGRVVPARYPEGALSRLYLNDGSGGYVLDTLNAGVLSGLGMVSGGLYTDVDVDGDADLLLSLDWGSLRLLENDGGVFRDVTREWGLSEYESKWNGVTTGDFNGDGLPDIVATSWGRNTRLAASSKYPLSMYFADFDENGMMDIVEARHDSGVDGLAPVRGRVPLMLGIPYVGRRVPSYHEFADATLEDVVGPALAGASILQIETLDNMVFMNQGGSFDAQPLPSEAQLAPAHHASVADFDGDGNEDLLLTQNFFPTETETSRYDAGRGLLLLGDGSGAFRPMPGWVSGIEVYGDQRGAAVSDVDADGRVDLVISQNGAASRYFHNRGAVAGLRVRLIGTPANPSGIGAMMRLVYSGRMGPEREIHGGSGRWSQDGAVQILGGVQAATAVWVRWPDGSEIEVPITKGSGEVTIRFGKHP
ncbi:MAG: VCBS repeat-containing protein [Gemmatimonadales bacterium]